MIVVTTRIIGTRIDVFSVWERTSGYAGPHSSFFTIGDVLMGKVGARRLPFEIDVLRAVTHGSPPSRPFSRRSTRKLMRRSWPNIRKPRRAGAIWGRLPSMVDHSLLPWRLRSNTELGRVTRWIEDASGSTVCELPTTYTAYLEEDARIEADGKTIVLAVNARLGSTVDTAIASAPPLCG